jgi:hypothetical protein
VNTVLDHLVVVADTLAQGAAWCQATFGVSPGPGGAHALMGTHNRLLRIASARYPLAYLEIIAIDSLAAAPQRLRWFGMDSERVRQAARRAPLLLHAAARTGDLDAAVKACSECGVDVGEILEMSRSHLGVRLQWRLTIRPDGEAACDGAMPALIQWPGLHPCETMPASGVALTSLRWQAEGAAQAKAGAALTAIGAEGFAVTPGPAWIEAEFATPAGPVTLRGGWPQELT